MHRHALLLLMLLLPCCRALSQETDLPGQQFFPVGISFEGGPGSFAVRDEFISRERYSGPLPLYSLTWTDVTAARANRIMLEYRTGAHVMNYNVSATITEFTFGLHYLYPIGRIPLFSKQVHAYLGPSPELFFHFRSQNLAGGGNAIFRAYSVAFLLSAGATASFFCPL